MSCTLPNPSSSGITLQNDSTTTYISRSVHDNPQQCQIFQMIPSSIHSTHHSIENQQQHRCPPTIVNMSCNNVIIKSRAHHADKSHLQRLERRAPSTNPNPKPKTRNTPSITKAPVIPPTDTNMPTAITRGIRINETVHFYTSPYPILTPSPSATPDTITNNGSITPPTADAATSGQLPLPLPVLIGVAVGGFVLVVIVLVLLLILIRQRNRDKEDANKVYPDQHSSHGQGYGQIQNDLEKARAMYMEAEKAKQQDAYHDKDQMEERYGGRTIRTDRPHLPRHLPRHDNKAFSMAQSVSSDGGYGTNSEHSGRSRQGRTQQRPMRSSSAGSGAGSAASLTIDTVGRTRESDRRERQAPAPIGPDMYQYHKQQIQQRELEEHYRKQRELQQSRATSSPSSSSPPSMFSESGTLPSSNYSAQPLIHPTEKMSSHSVQSLNASSFPPPPPPPGQPSVAGASDPSQRHPYDRIPVPPVPMIPDAVFSPALSTASSHRFQGYSGSERTASEAYIDLIPVDTANGSASPWMSPWATPALQPSSSRGKGKGKGKGKKVQDAVGESPPVRDTLYDAYDYAFREDAGANDGEIKYL